MHILMRAAMTVLVAVGLCAAAPEGAKARLCVAYALALSDIEVRGNAWAWWDNAAGRYERGHRPAVGSVLVFRRTPAMRLGHVSVVSAVVDRRTILVDHSWTGDRLYRGVRVIDTSPDNDWSSVRVWNPRYNVLGRTDYPIYGFIYSPSWRGGSRPAIAVAAAPMPEPQRLRPEPVRPALAFDPEDVPLPGRRPGAATILMAAAEAAAPAVGPGAVPVPLRRPGSEAILTAVAERVEPGAVPLPLRRPGAEMVLVAHAEALVARRVGAAGRGAVPVPPHRPAAGAADAVRAETVMADAAAGVQQMRPQELAEVPVPGRRPGSRAVPAPQLSVAALHDFVAERRKPATHDEPPQVASRTELDAF